MNERQSLKKALILVLVGLLTSSLTKAQEFKTTREVLRANLAATGGSEAWQAVHSIRRNGTRVLGTSIGERTSVFTEYLRYPGFLRSEETIDAPMGKMDQVMVTTPEGRWMSAPGGTRDLPERKWIASESAKDELFLLTNEGVELGPVEIETDDSGTHYVVSFSFEGNTYLRKYDTSTLFLTAAEAPGNDGSKNWSTFDDYREVVGFQTPFRWDSVATITVNRNGEISTSTITVGSTLEQITFNETLSDDLFSR